MEPDKAGRVMRSLACMVMLAFATSADAADLPLKPAPKAAQPATGSGPFAAPSAACQEWTDGCRTCQRAPNGEATCSNVGIACVSKEMKCVRQ
jgi:hypothetical protein